MNNNKPAEMNPYRNDADSVTMPSKEVPIQIMVPEEVRRQVALLGAGRGESIRTVVLRGLQAIGIKIPESQLTDRRGRRRARNGGDYGTQ